MDVRTPEEYREFHVYGTSRLIPVEELKRRINESLYYLPLRQEECSGKRITLHQRF